MEINYTACVSMTLEHVAPARPYVVKAETTLELKTPLENPYVGTGDLPNASGYHALTSAFVTGLLACIHGAHRNGYKDKDEHLDFIIKKLKAGVLAEPGKDV